MAIKVKCDTCHNIAIWFYMPGTSKYCDDCVPRGCSCNLELKEGIDESSEKLEDYIQPLDDKGREYPCCEFHYEEQGEYLE